MPVDSFERTKWIHGKTPMAKHAALFSFGLFYVNARDVHRSMSWIFFILSVVVDNDEI